MKIENSFMRIIKINTSNPDAQIIKEAAQLILDGGSVVIPTDTAYGIAVNALDKRAIKKLIKLKGRKEGKPFPVAIQSLLPGRQLAHFNRTALILAKKFWPGALTLVLPKKKVVPHILTVGSPKIGLRIPNLRLCFALAKKLPVPYTITSANLSGKKTPYSAKEVVKQFFGRKLKPDLILDGGKLPAVKPSTVVEVLEDKIKILRKGPINKKKILNALKKK